jgi:hypothetical protein
VKYIIALAVIIGAALLLNYFIEAVAVQVANGVAPWLGAIQ